MELILDLSHWITFSVCGLLMLSWNGFLLKTELKIRKSQTSVFTSKYAKMYSLLVLISESLIGLGVATWYFNPLCRISGVIYTLSVLSAVFVGFYQLDRLYYCFAQEQVC